MGCFPACFGTWKHRQTMKKVQHQSLSPRHEPHVAVKFLAATTESVKEEQIVNPVKLVAESETKSEEQINPGNGKKAELDHSNVEMGINELTGSVRDNWLEENRSGENDKKNIEEIKDDGLESNLSSLIQHPENHGNEDFLATNSKESTIDDNFKGGGGALIRDNSPPVQEEESCESLFSLSIDDSRKPVFAAEMGDKEVSSPLKPSDKENTAAIGSKRIAHFLEKDDEEDKENVNLEGKRMIKETIEKLKGRETETSLSSWLVDSPQKANISNSQSPESEKNYGDDRRILGAIGPPPTAELKQHLNEWSGSLSAGSTPRSCSATADDDQPSIGTVGRYWRQTALANKVMDIGLRGSTVTTKV